MNLPSLSCGRTDPDNAISQVPDPEVPVPLSKTTTRAFAASIAFVAAGATVAGAAVLHLPVLGFGPAPAATPTPLAVRRVLAVEPEKVAPVKIVRTRYVDDVVRRPTPVRAYRAPSALDAGQPRHALAATSYQSPPPPAVAPVVAAAPGMAPPTAVPMQTQPPVSASDPEGSEPDDAISEQTAPPAPDDASTTEPAETVDR
jgi:hypothetical protein